MLPARFDDLRTGQGWQFPVPREVIRATTIAEVTPALAVVEQATRDGAWAYGFVCYEAAPAFDPALGGSPVGTDDRGGLPLVWFAVTDRPVRSAALERRDAASTGPLWRWDWTEPEHAARVARIRDAIAAGDTYQCNLTTRLRARFTDDPARWYAELADRQHGGFHALVDTGDHTILSASPECFFTWRTDQLTVVPMKGTARRGVDHDSDRRSRDALSGSAKERAENLMIVDLVRNDLARIAVPGTVRTTRLFDCERYRTVWQLTSTVTGQVPPTTGLVDVFGALFPCGSVTGSPKSRTMALISELEDSPRGVYCGAVGWVAPPTEPERARFSVAIRTAVINNATSEMVYGVGGGITWDSTAPAEYAELVAKARVVTATVDDDHDGFAVIETIAVRGGRLAHLDRHRTRLLRTADWFGIAVDHDHLDALLTALATSHDRVVRVLLGVDGTLRHEDRPLPTVASRPVRLALDTVATADSQWRRHKTTRRETFDAARRRHPDADDVILVNDAGRITETTIANVAVRLGGQWCTPPVTDGLLPGVGREAMLADGLVVERPVRAADLSRATGIATISSVRGWRNAVLLPGPAPTGD